MLKIGLTGGIGSGKTIVATIFSVLGIPVFDADKQAKLLMETDDQLVISIKKVFGNDSYTNEKLNRSYLANIVFNDPPKLAILNSLVHPVTITVSNRWMEEQKTPYVIKEAALIFESQSQTNLDYVIGVSAPQQIRIKRVMKRDLSSRDQIVKRIERQIDEATKLDLCDFVLINDEEQLLIPQVLKLHEHFIQLSAKMLHS